MMRIAIALVLSAGAIAWLTDSAAAGDPDAKGPMGLTLTSDVFSWDDQDGEAGYHVFGNVDYWAPNPCASFGNPDIERIEFDEELPADTTSYSLPPPVDPRLTVVKGLTLRIDALDSGGTMITSDASGFVADAFCTPEEIAAAGTGPGPASSGLLSLASTALAAFGAIAVGGGLLLRRSRAR